MQGYVTGFHPVKPPSTADRFDHPKIDSGRRGTALTLTTELVTELITGLARRRSVAAAR